MKNFALFQNSRWTNTILEPPNSPFLKEGKGGFQAGCSVTKDLISFSRLCYREFNIHILYEQRKNLY